MTYNSLYYRNTILVDLGIGTLNITEAAKLVAKCMYCEGYIEMEADKDYDNHLFNKELEHDLSSKIKELLDTLINAINKGTLPTIIVKRNLDETLITEETFIDIDDLEKWLEERNVNLGSLYHDDYLGIQEDILTLAQSIINEEKFKRSSPKEYKKLSAQYYENKLYWFEQYSELLERNKNNNITVKEKPFHKKEKQSLLKLFIGLAISNYGYDSVLNGDIKASEILSDIVLHSGISIDEDTVRKFLKQALKLLPEINEV
ncbi:MAG: hypothetical protein COV35_00350 [Alphaproteobacteria bacterium CG11_big_fil_rev_8_21_14_0_20_39_49]|nr:MAG: hypothetical protein COV35_00350 [Alphaproteobacteria bacterium CG11_big_fil_rev_8_21_14_0_20_39_49]